MADYDWFDDRGPKQFPCCQSDFWHDKKCENHPQFGAANKHDRLAQEGIGREIRYWRPRGFAYLGMSGNDGDRRQMLWGCRRGCGTVVWHIEDHIKNVCPTFEPVVGQADAESL